MTAPPSPSNRTLVCWHPAEGHTLRDGVLIWASRSDSHCAAACPLRQFTACPACGTGRYGLALRPHDPWSPVRCLGCTGVHDAFTPDPPPKETP